MFSGCDKDPNEENGDGASFSVEGDVYTCDNYEGGHLYAPYIPWGGDLKISVGDYERYSIGTGEIKNGKLKFSLKTPEKPQKMNEAYYHWDVYEKWGAEYVNFTYSDPNAKTDYLQLQGKELGKPSIIRYMNYSATYPKNTCIDAFYVYVDRDVTITAIGVNYPNTTHENINLPLSKGWNKVYRKYVFTDGTPSSTVISFGIGDEGCKWIIE